MSRTSLVAWGDVPPGSVVWDASPEHGGDSHASVAVRFPEPDSAGRDGAWTAVHGGPTYSSSGGWAGPMYSAPVGVRPLVPDFVWAATQFFMAREDCKVKVIAGGLTAAQCASLGAMTPAEIAEWARKLRPPRPAAAAAVAVDAADAT